MPEEDF
jgi:hypothetical protein